MTHPDEIQGRWWLCASTPEGATSLAIRSASARFTITPGRRLIFDFTLVPSSGRLRTVHGIAAAHATPAGLFPWRGRASSRFGTWFRWGYRITAEGRMLVITHPGSIATHRTALVLCRDSVDTALAADLLRTEVQALEMTPDRLRDLIRHPR